MIFGLVLLLRSIVNAAIEIAIPSSIDSIGNPGIPDAGPGGGAGVEIMEADFIVIVREACTAPSLKRPTKKEKAIPVSRS